MNQIKYQTTRKASFYILLVFYHPKSRDCGLTYVTSLLIGWKCSYVSWGKRNIYNELKWHAKKHQTPIRHIILMNQQWKHKRVPRTSKYYRHQRRPWNSWISSLKEFPAVPIRRTQLKQLSHCGTFSLSYAQYAINLRIFAAFFVFPRVLSKISMFV